MEKVLIFPLLLSLIKHFLKKYMCEFKMSQPFLHSLSYRKMRVRVLSCVFYNMQYSKIVQKLIDSNR